MSSLTSTDITAVKKLGDFISLQRGTTYKSSLLGQPGAVLIGLASIEREGGFRNNKLETYGGDCPSKISLKPGDLYVSLKDITHDGHLLGAVARIPSEIEHGRLTQDTVKLVFEKELFPKNYIYWLLRTPHCRNYCRSHQTGTTNLGLSREDFLSFSVPPITEETNAIVIALESIEKKIKNLRKQNETLELIAQTLFKHWFVDFEFPNEDRKPYKSSGGAMERSDLGEIPAGWSAETLEECLEHLIDNRGKTPEFFDSGIPALSAKFVKGGDLVNRDSFNYVSHELFEQSEKLRMGDVILTSEAPLGETYFIAKETRYYPAQRVFALRANKSIISCSYLNYWLSSSMGQFFLKRRASGSTVQGIKQSELHQCEVIVPDRKIQDRVSEALTKILSRKEVNSDQIQTLTKTRDRLLPQLMSGKLRITE